MSLEEVRRQKSRQLELPMTGEGEALEGSRSGETATATHGDERSGTDRLMEEVVEWENVQAALKRVRKNKGSPGIDGMTVNDLSEYVATHWEGIRASLLAGTYQPQPVRRQMIPKSNGGERMLGIPTVLDRFVQQAILQVLQPRFDPSFSNHSYGFRPRRSAHDAVRAAHRYIDGGRHWVVDIDLEKFFDRVNHDVLMGKLAKRIADRRLLGLIRRYLAAGMMADGVTVERHEGTPQGGPLSPLLANLLLDEVDRELERRGHAFARYADDCNVYVRSKRAGERVMGMLRRRFARLRLRLNEQKSAVAPVWSRSFLGYTFLRMKTSVARRSIASKALDVMKHRIRQMTGRCVGRSLETVAKQLSSYLRGWKNYFILVELKSCFESLDSWIRHRLRAIQLKQWKYGPTVCRELMSRGVSRPVARAAAAHYRSFWKTAGHWALHTALSTRYFDELGLVRLAT